MRRALVACVLIAGCARSVPTSPDAIGAAVRVRCDVLARGVEQRARAGLVTVDAARVELATLHARCQDARDLVGGAP